MVRFSVPVSSKVVVVGAGAIGLPTAGVLAHYGHDVHVVDIDIERIQALRDGLLPFYESGLEDLLNAGVREGRLTFTTDYDKVADADFFFICVSTPESAGGRPNDNFVRQVIDELKDRVRDSVTVVIKSTALPATLEYATETLASRNVHIVVNPEFLRMGSAVYDSLHPSRIVLGSHDHAAATSVAALFAPAETPIFLMDARSAQVAKYASNIFLANHLSMVHAVARFCDAIGVDAPSVLAVAGADPRIGADYLGVAPGWGGSCFPKDSAAVVALSQDYGFHFGLVEATIQSNEEQFDFVTDRIVSLVGNPSKALVTVLGLTFKPETSDRRDSPAQVVVARLTALGLRINAYDPTMAVHKAGVEGVQLWTSPYEAINGSSLVAVLTKWPEFINLDWSMIAASNPSVVIFDPFNYLPMFDIRAAGLEYVGIGRQ